MELHFHDSIDATLDKKSQPGRRLTFLELSWLFESRQTSKILSRLSNKIHPTIYTKYLITHSMVQSPSWEANWFAASQEILRISRNPKVHYRTHKVPPPVSILGQPNPVHIPTSHLLEIYPNIIHPSKPRSPSGLLPSGFPTKTILKSINYTHTHKIHWAFDTCQT